MTNHHVLPGRSPRPAPDPESPAMSSGQPGHKPGPLDIEEGPDRTRVHRAAATTAGILYITGTVAGVLSMLVIAPVRDARDPLAAAAENSGAVVSGALLILVMGTSAISSSTLTPPMPCWHWCSASEPACSTCCSTSRG